MPPRFTATIEARMTSSRLPGKVLALAEGKPMLELMIERLRFVPEISEIVIATTGNATDDPVEAIGKRLGVGVFRGSEEDVLERLVQATRAYKVDTLVQLTGDCPLIDPKIISKVIQHYRTAGVDYVSNVLTRSYPIGMDTQVYAASVLHDVLGRADQPKCREHPSLYIYKHPDIYSLSNVPAPSSETRPELRLTLDTPEDLAVIRQVFAALRPDSVNFSVAKILAYLDANPDVARINAAIKHRYV
jgi:spore coat polysaccharide biosynthesis protein SpsF